MLSREEKEINQQKKQKERKKKRLNKRKLKKMIFSVMMIPQPSNQHLYQPNPRKKSLLLNPSLSSKLKYMSKKLISNNFSKRSEQLLLMVLFGTANPNSLKSLME